MNTFPRMLRAATVAAVAVAAALAPAAADAAGYDISWAPERCNGPRAVNDSGQVVGTLEVSQRLGKKTFVGTVPYRWDPVGGLGYLGGKGLGVSEGYAVDTNAAGQVVGVGHNGATFYNGRPPVFLAVLWEGAAITDLGALPGKSGTVASAVNASGQVVGMSGTIAGRPAHAFLWEKGKGMRDLSAAPGALGSAAIDVNAAGQVVGYNLAADGSKTPFLWEDGKGMQPLALAPGLGAIASAEIKGLSDGGVVYGDVRIGTVTHQVVWRLPQPGEIFDKIAISDVNASGTFVGGVTLPTGEKRAALHDAAHGGTKHLQDLVPGGHRLETATAISNAGHIAGMGVPAGAAEKRCYLLTPRP